MGKVWPADSVAYMEATTRLSTITALDESPLVEGLLYAGSDDGLVQVTEDGGKTWRKVDSAALTAAGVPEFTYVTDVQSSPRDGNTVLATLNDWNRGNYKPYVVKSTDRGKTWASISGDLPQRSGAWSVAMDTVNPNLIFAGMEFGLFVTVDGGAHWTQMAGVPTTQVRDITIQRRDNDLIAGTFGRGVFILDDYTALREVTSQSLGGARAPVSDARGVSVQRAGTVRGHLGQHHLPEPAVRRAADLQPRAGRLGRRWRSRSPTTRGSRCAGSS